MLKLATSRLSVSSWPTSSFNSLSPTPKYLALSIRGVRVGGVEIPDHKRLEFSLQYIHGIGRTKAHQILCDLNMENKFTKDLSEHEIISLREEVSKYLIEHQLVIFLFWKPFHWEFFTSIYANSILYTKNISLAWTHLWSSAVSHS